MLHSLTITEAHKKLRSREVSAEDLVKASIARIEAVDSKLNAVVHRNFEGALDEAKKIDSRGTFDHALTGIPYLAKDVFCEKGIATTACSNILRAKDYKPPFDSTTTKRLKAVGAISIGKSNTDEFTMGGSTESSCFGPTRCPWDQTRVAGGSSGGSAAAVTADECIFALGTDTGGSIREPAAYSGCSGLKVSYGRTSRFGVMSMASSLDTIGHFGKTVEDLAIVLQAIAGKDPLDGTTSDAEVPDYLAALKGDVKGLKIGLPKEYFGDGLHEDVRKAVMEAAEVLKSQGAAIVDISLPHTRYGVATYYVICPCEVSSNMARYDGIRYGHIAEASGGLVEYYHAVRSEGFGAEVKRRIMIGTYALSSGYYDAYYRQAQKVRTLVKQDFDNAFKKVDLIMSPTAPTPATKVGENDNNPLAAYMADVFTVPGSLAGIPGLSIPCGFTKDELPVGLQLLAPHFREDVLLRAGDSYQRVTDWGSRKPKL
jgi:aspartyl-tRNA(Asn)/glutamyl-tRNA(Gln) amidotransferase subunit A